jgi:hypothetical protein
MAAIRERVRGDGARTFHVQVRMRGFPARTATFPNRRQAERWAKTVEAEMIEGRHFRNAEARRRTLAEAIDRYVAEEVPKKRNGQMYAFTMPWWKKNLGHLRLSDVTPAVLVEQRGKLGRETYTRAKPESKRSTVRGQPAKQFTRSAATVNRYLAKDTLLETSRTGTVVELCNQIELYMKAIIEAHIAPPANRQGFLRDYVLNNAIVSFGSKIKLVLAINEQARLVALDAAVLHKVGNLRNAFAHNDLISGIRAELATNPEGPGAVSVVVESIKANGGMQTIARDQAYEEFRVAHAKAESCLKEMLGKLRA